MTPIPRFLPQSRCTVDISILFENLDISQSVRNSAPWDPSDQTLWQEEEDRERRKKKKGQKKRDKKDKKRKKERR
jgi:hypothetical protein